MKKDNLLKARKRLIKAGVPHFYMNKILNAKSLEFDQHIFKAMGNDFIREDVVHHFMVDCHYREDAYKFISKVVFNSKKAIVVDIGVLLQAFNYFTLGSNHPYPKVEKSALSRLVSESGIEDFDFVLIEGVFDQHGLFSALNPYEKNFIMQFIKHRFQCELGTGFIVEDIESTKEKMIAAFGENIALMITNECVLLEGKKEE